MSNHRDIIDGNLVKLCKLTHCNVVFIDTCTERNVITREDRDEIEKEKIHYKRNRVLYTIMRLKDETYFQKLVQIMKEEDTAQSGDVLNILVRNQSGPSRQIRPGFQNPVEPEEQNVWFDVHEPITSFVGREKELKKLHEIVTRNADKDTQVAVMSQLSSVSGMGGIGKTTLAREYARRFASYFKYNIIWINAETTSTTEESFRKLLDEISVQNKIIRNQNEENVSISKITTDTYEYFSKRKCLFIFDNVEEYKSTVAPFIPKSYQPGKIRPYILMTSRKQRLVDDCIVLRLDILTIEDAEKFIKFKLQKCMRQINDESVIKLANELQCHPLALQQAVSYIRNQVQLKSFFPERKRDHIEDYVKLLEENPKVPLNHKHQDDTMDDYAYTVMRTWDVTLKAIEREEYGSQAIELLEMLSYYPPENIVIKHFNSAFSDEELQHSFVILENYSLISRARNFFTYVNIHRLVQQVIRVKNKDEAREEYILDRCLSLNVKNTKFYAMYNDDVYWNIWKRALGHESLVIKYRSILGKIFTFTSTKDLEILNSSLEILEKNVTGDELMDLYVIFVNATLDKDKHVLCGDFSDLLVQKALTRLNVLVQLKHYDSIYNILSSGNALSWIESNSVTPTPKFVRDVMWVISNYCFQHSAEIFLKYDDTPYYLIKFWLRLKELGHCRTCFKLLVLEGDAESLKNMVNRELHLQFFKNFHLFNKYLLELGVVSDTYERDFVREVLDFSRSISLDVAQMTILETADVLLCNILCLLLLNYNHVQEIMSCVSKISVQMENKLTEFQKHKTRRQSLFYIRFHFERTVKYMTLTLNRLVLIETTPLLVNLEWAHCVDKIIKFIGAYRKIVEIVTYTDKSFTSYLPELTSTMRELGDCCKRFVDIDEKVSSDSN